MTDARGQDPAPDPHTGQNTGPYTGPPPTAEPQWPHPVASGYGYPPPPYGGYPAGPYGPPPHDYDPRSSATTVRPGQATAAAVLGWVCSGLLIVGALILFAGASVLSGLSDATDGRVDRYTAEFIADGVLNLLAAGLLIAGGVVLFARSRKGRALLSAGGVVVAGEAVYWLARWTSVVGAGSFVFWALVYGGLAVIGVGLCWSSAVTAWLDAPRPGSGQTPTR